VSAANKLTKQRGSSLEGSVCNGLAIVVAVANVGACVGAQAAKGKVHLASELPSDALGAWAVEALSPPYNAADYERGRLDTRRDLAAFHRLHVGPVVEIPTPRANFSRRKTDSGSVIEAGKAGGRRED
jgi:hypothetical protein